jgi:uncharacterized repeat protein (TIGR03803 family)
MARVQAQTPVTEIVLHNFQNPPKGANPYAGVLRDPAGNLYGTTLYGGSWGAGVVYKVNAAGQQTVPYNFTAGTDGGYPYAGVIRDSDGNLYGTALNYGITASGATAFGVVYKLDATGHETVLYGFTGGADGAYPTAGVISDSDGNLYGTTSGGGAANAGVVFKLDTTGQETVLHSFTGGADGGYPQASVFRDAAGNLYGTTAGGGTGGAGVVFKLDTAGKETVLCSFSGGANGGTPEAGVIRDAAGNLYGATNTGGSANAGVVFQLDAVGQATVLHSFTGGADGADPYAGVIRDSAGNLYGTTAYGGTAGAGVVFKLDPTGQETVLHSFTGGADGAYPFAGVIRDADGNLYGTTNEAPPQTDEMYFTCA